MSTTTEIGKTTVSTPSDREIVLARTFDAPRALVFEAYTKPEHLQQWLLGPEGWTMPVCEVDLRVGGKWRYRWEKPGQQGFEMHGEYREVVPPERIVHTESMDDNPETTVNTVVFTEENGRTTVTTTSLCESQETRDMILGTGMAYGVNDSYDRLEKLLAGLG